MSLTVWKTVLDVADVQTIFVPAGAELICAREQFERVCIWYRCDPHRPTEPRNIAIVGTGNPAPADGRYIGTASLQGGTLILHVFAWPQ